MFQAIISAALAALIKGLFGRWLAPKEKADGALLATQSEAQALAAPPSTDAELASRLRKLERPE